jgi:integrase
MTSIQTKTSNWENQLQSFIDKYNSKRFDNGRVASHKTQNERAKFLFKLFNDLHALGYHVEPKNFKEKHIKVICQKFEDDGIAAATIQTYLSFIRAFCSWIGKAGMMGDISEYFSDVNRLKRSYQASYDKSWDIPEIEKERIINDLLRLYPYVGMQLLLQDAFGLRRKEAMMLRPFVSEKNGQLHVFEGTKGGKPRVITTESEYQKFVIELAKGLVGNSTGHTGDPNLTLEQNLKKYSNVLYRNGIKKFGKGALGITGHGLRAGFAIDQMEKRGVISVLRGGELGQLPPDEEAQARMEVSQLLGHNRPAVTTAYSGPQTKAGLSRMKKTDR